MILEQQANILENAGHFPYREIDLFIRSGYKQTASQ